MLLKTLMELPIIMTVITKHTVVEQCNNIFGKKQKNIKTGKLKI